MQNGWHRGCATNDNLTFYGFDGNELNYTYKAYFEYKWTENIATRPFSEIEIDCLGSEIQCNDNLRRFLKFHAIALTYHEGNNIEYFKYIYENPYFRGAPRIVRPAKGSYEDKPVMELPFDTVKLKDEDLQVPYQIKCCACHLIEFDENRNNGDFLRSIYVREVGVYLLERPFDHLSYYYEKSRGRCISLAMCGNFSTHTFADHPLDNREAIRNASPEPIEP